MALLMRTLIGVGTPRGLHARLAAMLTLVVGLWARVIDLWRVTMPFGDHRPAFTPRHHFELLPVGTSEWAV